MPTVSVIVPVYKVEKYIHQCVDSILAQTFTDFELILVDDGSPDNCPAICDEYAEKDSRVRVIHQKNSGLSAARNAGLDIASGEYLMFVDSDDWVSPGFLEQMITAILKDDADIVICGAEKFGDIHEVTDLVGRILSPKDIALLLEPPEWQYVVAWNKIYRGELFSNIRFREGFIHEDEFIIHHVLKRCRKVSVISERLYHYRQSAGSITKDGFQIQRTDKLSALADRISFAFANDWNSVGRYTIQRYAELFLDYYFRFPRTAENEMYFNRMDESLRVALPFIWRVGKISIWQKICLTAIHINPQIYISAKRLLKSHK